MAVIACGDPSFSPPTGLQAPLNTYWITYLDKLLLPPFVLLPPPSSIFIFRDEELGWMYDKMDDETDE
jgi:hypothetical protein